MILDLMPEELMTPALYDAFALAAAKYIEALNDTTYRNIEKQMGQDACGRAFIIVFAGLTLGADRKFRKGTFFTVEHGGDPLEAFYWTTAEDRIHLWSSTTEITAKLRRRWFQEFGDAVVRDAFGNALASVNDRNRNPRLMALEDAEIQDKLAQVEAAVDAMPLEPEDAARIVRRAGLRHLESALRDERRARSDHSSHAQLRCPIAREQWLAGRLPGFSLPESSPRAAV